MTRINASIRPIELTNSHLIAEIRELPRILNTVKSGKAKIENKTDVFKLGTNHTTFFYGRLKYLVNRHKDLVNEAKIRGFNIMDYSDCYKDIPPHLFNDWRETKEARELLKERINLRLTESKQKIRFYDRVVTLEEALIK
jgi:deoxyribonuclease (pyrimidine dimer)